ncbi:type II toxin-antitoxin system VapC family toxin [Noviherbaspirillum pedocola]|uniref:Type II toxin-antitoxin system VapC family toxin n=1 Tax=Noviherbaspirillum pedocola TaxID=2801341 RepID=A0A934SWS0_9BURK|nr:type II toxin-antitoxin system VapC family toxin [Noviherbaspirillum pedocola]MBK4738241.1 type II toxin-antitoxin system VapC family toxin [Noviherbaspirillum pedocola]
MIYVDTSVLVALCTNEPKSSDVARWYGRCSDELISAMWCVTEFASALGIKQRTGQITSAQAQNGWQQFERLCSHDLQLFPIDPATFHRAAMLTLQADSGLRSGDALHLAAALDASASSMATLDTVLAKNAVQMKLKLIKL